MNTNRIIAGVFLAILLLKAPFHAFGDAPLQRDTLYLSMSDEYQLLDYMSYYANTTALPIESIITKAKEGHFIAMRGKPLNVGFTNNYYWAKINLNNPTNHPVELMFMLMNPAINEVELFKIKNDSAISLGRSGDHYPFRHRPVYFNLITYPITLQPGEKASFYTYLDKKGENFKMSFRLPEARTFEHFAFREYFVIGIFIGTLILIMFFNVFLLISLRDEVHGWYSMYVLVAILTLLAFEGMDFQFLYPNSPAICDVSRLLTSGMTLFLMLIVMRKFYSLSKANSRFYHAAVFVQWFALLVTLCSLIVYKLFPFFVVKKIYMSVFSIITVSCILVITLASIEKIKQGFKPAYFYLSAVWFLFLGAINFLLNLFGLITNFVNQINGVQIGIVIETVVISFGILYRYNLFKKENEKLAIELEVNKTQTTIQLISVQEAERKRIAEDLHDDLGGNIAAIKMNVQNLHLDDVQLQSIIHLLDKASDDVRNISHNLMPPEFNETNLKDLWLSRYNHLNSSGPIRFNFHSSGTDKRFNKIDELMIYRIISELTNNILKHSRATEATIQLIYYDTYLEIMAEDNGQGISQKGSDGIGLKNIQSRVAFLGGRVNIHSNSFGTTVIVNIDYKK